MGIFEQTLTIFFNGAFVAFFSFASYLLGRFHTIKLFRVASICSSIWALVGLGGLLEYIPGLTKVYAHFILVICYMITVPFLGWLIKCIYAVHLCNNAISIHWLYKVISVCLVFLGVWYLGTSFILIPYSYCLLYFVAIIIWSYTLWHIYAMIPIQIQQADSEIYSGSSKEGMLAMQTTLSKKSGFSNRKEADIPQDPVLKMARKYAFAPRLKQAMEVDQLFLRSTLNINELARMLGTNRAYLSSYLNIVLGVSFFDYINGFRIVFAESLLRTTSLPVDQIAEKAGFNNAYSFRRVFLKKYGVTPTEWRHENGKVDSDNETL